ncbi:protease complex subunit PrcB family protein [Marinobacter sp. 1Y8]
MTFSRIKTSTLITALITSAALASGCVVSGDHSEQVSAGAAVKSVAAMAHCGFTAPGLVLATSASDWARFSDSLGARLPAWPDQPGRWLLVASMGKRNTGGYSIALHGAELDDQRLSVAVSQHRPAPDAMVTQALTTPCVVLEIPAQGWRELVVTGDSPFPVQRSYPD